MNTAFRIIMAAIISGCSLSLWRHRRTWVRGCMKGEVKERGMIFNDEMVRAILGGNKTQTRRIVEEKFYGRAVAAELLAKHCPYGQPGDRIWVRETYRVHGKATDVATLVYRASVRNSDRTNAPGSGRGL